MKLTSKQFKTKSAYFLPFLRAWYLHYSEHLIYKVSIVYLDGSTYNSYCSMISYNVFHRPMVKSALFILFDEQSYSSELQFFISFLMSCNHRQLVTFLDDMFDSVSACPDEITSEFMKVLPSYIGENRFRYYLSYISNF